MPMQQGGGSSLHGGAGGTAADFLPLGSGAYALGASTSMGGLVDAFGGPGGIAGAPCGLTSGSSGHLVQDLEDLRLTPQLQQQQQQAPMFGPTQQQHMQQQMQMQTQPGAQHSHQSSMDSGVGHSVAGISNPSANQTPEHSKVTCFDSGESSRYPRLGPFDGLLDFSDFGKCSQMVDSHQKKNVRFGDQVENMIPCHEVGCREYTYSRSLQVLVIFASIASSRCVM